MHHGMNWWLQRMSVLRLSILRMAVQLPLLFFLYFLSFFLRSHGFCIIQLFLFSLAPHFAEYKNKKWLRLGRDYASLWTSAVMLNSRKCKQTQVLCNPEPFEIYGGVPIHVNGGACCFVCAYLEYLEYYRVCGCDLHRCRVR